MVYCDCRTWKPLLAGYINLILGIGYRMKSFWLHQASPDLIGDGSDKSSSTYVGDQPWKGLCTLSSEYWFQPAFYTLVGLGYAAIVGFFGFLLPWHLRSVWTWGWWRWLSEGDSSFGTTASLGYVSYIYDWLLHYQFPFIHLRHFRPVVRDANWSVDKFPSIFWPIICWTNTSCRCSPTSSSKTSWSPVYFFIIPLQIQTHRPSDEVMPWFSRTVALPRF